MRFNALAVFAGLVVIFASPGMAAREPHKWPQLGVETRIPFPGDSTILSYEPDQDAGIWLEDRHHRWYYAKLIGPCTGLSYSRNIGFSTNGLSRFDRFSSLVVDGRRCKVQSVVTAAMPLPRSERLRLKAEAKARDHASTPPVN